MHLSVNRHLGSFHLLASVNNAAMNISMQVSVQASDSYSLGHMLRSGIAVVLFFMAVAPFYVPTSNAQRLQCLRILINQQAFFILAILVGL